MGRFFVTKNKRTFCLLFDGRVSTGSGEGAAIPVNSKRGALFKKIAGYDEEIDARELQDLLTATFSKGTVMHMYIVLV